MSDIVHLHKVSHRYEGGRDVLSDVSFTLSQGEMAFITGASGAGKTTLLKLVALLCLPARGQVMVDGVNVAALKRRQIPEFRQNIGLVFQNFNLLYDRTVFDNVALPLVIRGHAHADVGRKTRAALDAVGLLGKEGLYPITLSGGEQQRLCIARAIVHRPAILLADEPTGNLDAAYAAEIGELFRSFNQVGATVVIATHDAQLAERLRPRLVTLASGRIDSAAAGHA